MFKNFKLAVVISAGFLFAGGANATSVPAGTLALSPYHYSPVVDTGAGTVNLAASGRGAGVSYSNGTGQFAGLLDPPFATFANTAISFGTNAGSLISYSGANAITNFLTFYDSPDGTQIAETYVFSLDQSLQTVSNNITGQGQTIALYFLGDLTGTGSDGIFSTATPTALTLTLNKTGGSDWTFSATLSNPPPGLPGTPVPEPASMALLGGGLAALGILRRRRRKS